MAAEQAKPAAPEELALPGLWVRPLRGMGATRSEAPNRVDHVLQASGCAP